MYKAWICGLCHWCKDFVELSEHTGALIYIIVVATYSSYVVKDKSCNLLEKKMTALYFSDTEYCEKYFL